MVTLPGIINIKTIHGRNGPFNVGTLKCDIGEFTVKDSSIEEFDEGSYSGSFIVSQIKPSSYFAGGQIVLEVRAYLEGISLDDDLPGEAEETELERDPILDEPVPESTTQQSDIFEAPADDEKVTDLEVGLFGEDKALMDLFGVLWPLGETVKLDPSVNRAVFRKQKDYLKSIGYKFMATNQHWVKES